MTPRPVRHPRHLFSTSEWANGGRRCEAPDGDGICNLLEEEHPEPVVVATIETEHFTFEGVGDDEEEARDALLNALLHHTAQMGDRVEPQWFEPYLESTRIRELWPGAAYRDGEEVA